MTATHTWNTTDLVAADKAHHLHPVSNLKHLSEKGPLIMARGEGIYLWDTDGNRYIDGFAGLWNVNVGHGRHELAVAASEQIDELAFVPTFFGLASPPTIELATKLASMLPGSLNHVQFTSGGAESNETSLKIARYFWWLNGKSSYHLPGSQFEFQGELIPSAPADMYAALGKNDQKIYVVPSKKLVVIRMGDSADGSNFGLSDFDDVLWQKISTLIN